MRTERFRPAVAGALVAVAYLTTAVLSYRSGLLPVRPLYEGTGPPPPYHWVTPPAGLADGNVKPSSGKGTVKLPAGGSEPQTIATDDAQAIIAFEKGSIKPRKGQTSVEVTITPLDPAPLGAPPKGDEYDGNAYRISAVYKPSGAPAEIAASACSPGQTPKLCPTVVLRYAFGATGLFRLDGAAWTAIDSSPAGSSLQIFGDVASVGTFVAGAPKSKALKKKSSNIGLIIGIVLGAMAVIGAVAYARLPALRRMRKKLRKKKKKRAPPPKKRR